METARQARLGVSADHLVIFLEKTYFDEILSFYPIIVSNLDVTNGELLMTFLCNCKPFAELDYDYLVVVYKNDQDKVLPNGLKIAKDFLKKLKITIDTEDITLLEQLTPTFPEEVTTRILECFEH